MEGPPTATVVPSDSVGKRSKGRVVGGLVAVIALLGAGGFAVSKIAAGEDGGGAASPTEVGTRLMDSLGSEDALGVVDLLLPGERETFRQPLIDLVDNLKRLEIVGSSASLDKLGGVDLAFDDVRSTRPRRTSTTSPTSTSRRQAPHRSMATLSRSATC